MPLRNPPLPELYRHLLEHLTTAVLWFDAQLNLHFINPAGEMLFAVSARRLNGMQARELFAGADHILHELERALDSGHGFTEREVQITFHGGNPMLFRNDRGSAVLSPSENGRFNLVAVGSLAPSLAPGRSHHQVIDQVAYLLLVTCDAAVRRNGLLTFFSGTKCKLPRK